MSASVRDNLNLLQVWVDKKNLLEFLLFSVHYLYNLIQTSFSHISTNSSMILIVLTATESP